jgi:proline dehydrogenase
MLRSLLIYLSHASWARQIVTRWGFAWRAASRFVAGEQLEDAIRVVGELNEKGINATLDHLGEHTTSPEKASQATEDILKILEEIDRTGVRSNVSIKLTQIGLALDPALCEENFCRILDSARAHHSFVRIDMEESNYVDPTLALLSKMSAECGCENLGTVIQSYLYRSDEDIERLKKQGTRIRLCKGAYQEPPEIAFPKKSDVDASYDRLAQLLIDGAMAKGSPALSADGKIPPIPAFATHDPDRIEFAKNYAQKVDLPNKALEFQMLHGIRRDLQEELAQRGYPVRVYVPYGSEWYPYFTRRLAERPANLWFFLSNLVRR